MLNKLLPNQVAAYWDSIKHGLEQSCPSDTVLTADGLNKYLIALMSGTLQCWFCTERIDDRSDYYGNLITKIQTDEITGAKTLLLASLYMFKTAPDHIWEDAHRALIDFGRANDCKKIIAYTTNPAVLRRGTSFNFNIAWQVMTEDI